MVHERQEKTSRWSIIPYNLTFERMVQSEPAVIQLLDSASI